MKFFSIPRSSRTPSTVAVLAACVTLAGCDDPAPRSSSPITDRIDNSTDVETCAWPGAVWMRFYDSHLGGARRCGGTLIHPQIVVTSARCAESYPTPFGAVVGLGSMDETDDEPVIDVADCQFSPDHDFDDAYGDMGDNIAFCVLATPVEHPLVPAAMGCEMTAAYVGASATLVGYGTDNIDDFYDEGKRWGEATISAIWPDINGLTRLTGDTSFCAASDQGGPVMTRLPDGSWRTWGIMVDSTSLEGDATSCFGDTWVVPLDRHIPWIEAETGIDVTPCFDNDGTWNPGPDCQQFYAADPNVGHGTFSDQCAGTPLSGYSDICGAPYEDASSEDDTDTGGTHGDGGADDSGDTSGPADADGGYTGGDDAAQDGETGCACDAGGRAAPPWLLLTWALGLFGWRARRR